MIIYGYQHFSTRRLPAAARGGAGPALSPGAPVDGLSRRPAAVAALRRAVRRATSARRPQQNHSSPAARPTRSCAKRAPAGGARDELRRRLTARPSWPPPMRTSWPIGSRARRHRTAVLAETAKLHAGDAENLRLWREFLPACLDEIDRIYQRLERQLRPHAGRKFLSRAAGRGWSRICCAAASPGTATARSASSWKASRRR